MSGLGNPLTLSLLVAAVGFLGFVLHRSWLSVRRTLGRSSAAETFVVSPEVLALLHAKKKALTALKETELDRDTGKVADEEFAANQAAASQRAIEIMKQIDAIRSQQRYGQRIDEDLQRLEELRQKLVPAQAVPQPEVSSLLLDEVPQAPSAAALARARLVTTVATIQCPSCQAPAGADERYCDRCGTALHAKCGSCATPLRPGARYCPSCGRSVSEGAEAQS